MPFLPPFRVFNAYKGCVVSYRGDTIISFSPKDAMYSIQTKKAQDGFMGSWGAD